MTTTARPGRYDPDNPYAALDALPPRHAALVGATSALRPARSRAFPLETILVILGGICLPVGIIAIIIGWYGAAHTGKVYEQNDYLISGGLLGLGLIFAGGFLYFGYWITRQIHTTTSTHQQTIRALNRLEGQLATIAAATAQTAAAAVHSNGNGHRDGGAAGPEPEGAMTTGAGRAGRTPAGSRAGRTVPAPPLTLVATERGTLLHRPDCPVVANKQNLREVDPDTPGFRACQICAPFDQD